MWKPESWKQRRLRLRVGARRKWAISVSLAVHVAGAALLAHSVVPTVVPRATFDGYRRAISLQAAFTTPQWNPADKAMPESTTPQPTVVVRPRAARVALHRYLASPYGSEPYLDPSPQPVDRQDLGVPPHTGASAAAATRPPAEAVNSSQPTPMRKRDLQRQISVASIAQPPGSGRLTHAQFISNAPPVYPDRARLNGWQGTVWLQLDIDRQGQVVEVSVIQSSGHPILDAAAVNAVRQWRGQPARVDGVAVPSHEFLPVQFELP